MSGAPDTGMSINELNEAILTLVGVKRTFRDLEFISSHRTDDVRRLWEWAGDQGDLIGSELHRLMMALDQAIPTNDEEDRQRAIALAVGADLVPDARGWRIVARRGEADAS